MKKGWEINEGGKQKAFLCSFIISAFVLIKRYKADFVEEDGLWSENWFDSSLLQSALLKGWSEPQIAPTTGPSMCGYMCAVPTPNPDTTLECEKITKTRKVPEKCRSIYYDFTRLSSKKVSLYSKETSALVFPTETTTGGSWQCGLAQVNMSAWVSIARSVACFKRKGELVTKPRCAKSWAIFKKHVMLPPKGIAHQMAFHNSCSCYRQCPGAPADLHTHRKKKSLNLNSF